MPKVVVDLEQAWRWWPKVGEKNTIRNPVGVSVEVEPVIELSEEFLAEWESVSKRYHEMQEHLEHCYRHQEGLTPLQNSPFKK